MASVNKLFPNDDDGHLLNGPSEVCITRTTLVPEIHEQNRLGPGGPGEFELYSHTRTYKTFFISPGPLGPLGPNCHFSRKNTHNF